MAPATAVRGTRLLVGVVVVAAAIVAALVLRSGGDDEPPDRPAHLLDLAPGSIRRIEVRDPATGRTGDADMSAVGADLHPLLAIRTFDRRRPDYGLDPPRLDVTITTATGRYRLLVGTTNFDRTGVYVAVGDRTALVLPRLADALGAAVGQAEP